MTHRSQRATTRCALAGELCDRPRLACLHSTTLRPRRASAPIAFTGAILAGGANRRMGRDKALLPVAGTPMVARVARALRAAGATETLAVGGDLGALAALGLRALPDDAPGQGPLAGIITALVAATTDVVVVAACDMPWLEGEQVGAAVAALGDLDVAVSAADGQWQPLLAAWSQRALPALRAAFSRGERAPIRAISALTHVVVDLGPGRWSTDLDTPVDLAAADTDDLRSHQDPSRRPDR